MLGGCVVQVGFPVLHRNAGDSIYLITGSCWRQKKIVGEREMCLFASNI
jgi:hypothetical protein